MDRDDLLKIIRKAKDEHETYLDLAFNQIDELPREIGDLKDLTWLNLSSNRLTTLPMEIGNLKNLKLLDLRNNELSNLPSELTYLGKLEALYLNGNPLGIPFEIMGEADPSTLFATYFGYYDFDWEEEEDRPVIKRHPLNEAKMLILGQGSVGKTSLIQQILYGTFDPSQTKTDGISISQYQVEKSQSRKTNGQPESIKLNLWDFGGQEIMHATHQFFLTKRSLYLLVLDARLTQEENRVEYWLKIIQSFGGDSPVLIVGNKIDQHPLDIDRTGLGKKYPNIVGILETSAATGAGIEALKTEIVKQVETLPHVRDLLPETWFTVKSILKELGRDQNFITQDEYLDLCGANEVADKTSQHTLISFLHDLGVVLHFQNDPRLEALGILNPQWVTNGVYRILNSHELFQNKGKLTISLLNNILNLPEYPSTTKR